MKWTTMRCASCPIFDVPGYTVMVCAWNSPPTKCRKRNQNCFGEVMLERSRSVVLYHFQLLSSHRYTHCQAMSGVPWTVSATTIVRNALSTHRYLKAPQIWAIGTQGIRPTLQPKLAFDKEGRIRMKKVSNIREGKRQWVPPPQKPLPDHPFQSMR